MRGATGCIVWTRVRREFLRPEPPVARLASLTCSRIRKKPLAALRVDGATVERACEATGNIHIK